MEMPNDFIFILRILIAFALGGLIGLERQWHHRDAGLRTSALVALGSALFMHIAYQFPEAGGGGRVAGAIVTGIGFLGAGVIMREGGSVRGLTTAATIWCAAAVGALCGGGLVRWAVYSALMIIAANTLLRPVSHSLEQEIEPRK